MNRLTDTADGEAMLAATRNGIYRSTNHDEADIAVVTFAPASNLAGRDIRNWQRSPSDPAQKCVAGGRETPITGGRRRELDRLVRYSER